jgi:hypothetical protein
MGETAPWAFNRHSTNLSSTICRPTIAGIEAVVYFSIQHTFGRHRIPGVVFSWTNFTASFYELTRGTCWVNTGSNRVLELN